MRRIPLGGLFLSACLGIGAAEPGFIPPVCWGAVFGLGATAALLWNRTILALCAAFFFFGFWQSFQRTTDQGYLLRANPHLASQVHQLTLEADNDSKAFLWGNRIKQRLFAKVTAVDGHPMRFRVQAELPGPPIDYGDRCIVQGRLALPERALNPGEFDERAYLQQQGVYLVLSCASAADVVIVNHGWGNPIEAIALRSRKGIEAIPTRSVENDRPIKALIEGITFGNRSEFDPDLLDLLQDTGTLHLFVIDGLKVTLLAGISWIAARFICLPRRWVAVLVVPFLVLYCAATGLSAAGLRATLMALFVLLGVSLEKPIVQLNTLSGSGIILLLWNPEELFQLGFQLSFTIVAIIVIAAHPLSYWLAYPFRADPWIPNQLISPARRVWQRAIGRSMELLSVCFICWAGSLPFSIFYFHRVSLSNVAANFLAVPIGTWILFTALTSILISPISSWASICLNNTNWLLAHLFLLVVRGAASCPGQAMNFSFETWSPNTKIVVLASGRSETIYFHYGSASGLLNPGSPSKYRRITEPFLRCQGVNELGFLSWTKPDRDHGGAATEVAKHFRFRNIANAGRVAVDKLPNSDPKERPIAEGIEIFRLNHQKMSAAPATQSDLQQPLVDCKLGPFQILLLNGNHQLVARQPARIVDVILAPSPRQFSSTELIRRFRPRAILYAQGKPSGKEQAAKTATPIWFLGEKGAVTLTLHKESLELSSYLGSRLTLDSRSR